MERYLKKKLPQGKFLNVSAKRSHAMSAVRGKGNKTTESKLRMSLVSAGVDGWTMHVALPGTPDFYFEASKIAIFVDGCFWHGCTKCGHTPKTNSSFWAAKLERNRSRDLQNNKKLKKLGVRVLRFWEHDLKEPVLKRTIRRVLSAI